MMKSIPLHVKIIFGMIAGAIVGIILSFTGEVQFAENWIKPFGSIFINLLKVIAVPLIIASLVKGITSLKNIDQLSKLGYKTILLYTFTTLFAATTGLLLSNFFKPGNLISNSSQLEEKYKTESQDRINSAKNIDDSPLQFLVDIFPSNIFDSMTDNGRMLQVICFTILFSISIVIAKDSITKPLKNIFESLNEIVMKMIELIMLFAPYGVFALIASLIPEFTGSNPSKTIDLLQSLLLYSLIVLLGLALLMFIFYPLLLKIGIPSYSYKKFFRGIFPAQIMGFSTSSSAATLPVTMHCVKKNLGVSEETASFVLPIGATINMDGTSLYQSIAAVFIAQVYGIDLSLTEQIGIVITATLASIGAAAVPSAGTIILIIVLQQAGIPLEGIALILAPDRLLDMFRTTVNITGDASVSLLIDKSNKN